MTGFLVLIPMGHNTCLGGVSFGNVDRRSSNEIGRGCAIARREAWQQSALNQREYCEAHGIPLKAFTNWWARFKAEPQLPEPKLLYRRRHLIHRLSHTLIPNLRRRDSLGIPKSARL